MRFLFFCAIAYVVYRFWKWTMVRFGSAKEQYQKREPSVPTETAAGGSLSELVQDPICKLYIAKEVAIIYKEHYFCSEKCKNNFEGRSL